MMYHEVQDYRWLGISLGNQPRNVLLDNRNKPYHQPCLGCYPAYPDEIERLLMMYHEVQDRRWLDPSLGNEPRNVLLLDNGNKH
jgi:hypothetical protein